MFASCPCLQRHTRWFDPHLRARWFQYETGTGPPCLMSDLRTTMEAPRLAKPIVGERGLAVPSELTAQ